MLNETRTDCVCTEPGWCPRHHCLKVRTFFELCRRSQKFFAIFEQGRGPGQALSAAHERRDLCRRRGAEVRREHCPTCLGHVEIKIFACALHTECSLAQNVAGVQCCQTCTDYVIAEQLLSTRETET